MNRTPAVKLLGISPSGFNATGESDIRNYYDHIASRQEKVLRDGIKRALDCIQIHVRGDIDPSVGFDFAPLGEEDRAALANLQKTKADTIAVYVDREILSPEEARKSLADDPDSGFSDIDPDVLPEGPEDGEGGDMPDEGMGQVRLDDASAVATQEATDEDSNYLPQQSANGTAVAIPKPSELGKGWRVDKAGAVYDGAPSVTRFAANGWRQPDAPWGMDAQYDEQAHKRDKDGKFTSGGDGKGAKGYQSSPMDSTEPDMERFETLRREQGGDYKKAAHAYAREKLQDRHIEGWTPRGTIKAVFTGGSWREIKKDMRDDPVKAALVPHIPDIIATGKYAPESPAHAHPDVKQFHTYRKTVRTIAGPKEAIVDVAERPEKQPRHQVYSLTREGTAAYSYRTEKESASSPVAPGQIRGTRKTPTQDSNAVDEETITAQFEVVNLRFADEGAA